MGLIECIQRLKALRTPNGPVTQGTFTPPPPMTQADMEAEVNGLVAAGSMRAEGAEHLLRHMAIAAARRAEHGPVREAFAPSPVSEADAAWDRRVRLRQSLHESGLRPEYWDLRLDQNPFLTEAGSLTRSRTATGRHSRPCGGLPIRGSREAPDCACIPSAGACPKLCLRRRRWFTSGP